MIFELKESSLIGIFDLFFIIWSVLDNIYNLNRSGWGDRMCRC